MNSRCGCIRGMPIAAIVYAEQKQTKQNRKKEKEGKLLSARSARAWCLRLSAHSAA